jgi:hypothetical protein
MSLTKPNSNHTLALLMLDRFSPSNIFLALA